MSRGSMKRRTLLQAVGGAGTASALASIAAPAIAQQPERTLRFTSLWGAGHPDYVSSDFYAEQVAKYTDGKLRINVFHNGSLGGDVDTVQGMRAGTIDMGRAGGAGVSTFIPEIAVFELPYLYKNLDQMKRALDACTPILRERFAQNNLEVLGFQFDGPRMTLSVKSLKTLADFKGIRFRVPQEPLYVEMIRAFGANPTPISLPELYLALRSGIVDACEGSAGSLYAQKYYEIAKYLLRTDHTCDAPTLVINSRVFATLSPTFQKALRDAGRDATELNLKLMKEANVTDVERLRKAGVTEFTPDLAPFIESTRPYSESFAKNRGGRAVELYEQIKKATAT
jgi:tripartite ATP-independent transporter DctP family solute receptor